MRTGMTKRAAVRIEPFDGRDQARRARRSRRSAGSPSLSRSRADSSPVKTNLSAGPARKAYAAALTPSTIMQR